MAEVVIIRVGLFIRIGDANRQFHQYCAVAGCECLRDSASGTKTNPRPLSP
jgi:hypothetical protein